MKSYILQNYNFSFCPLKSITSIIPDIDSKIDKASDACRILKIKLNDLLVIVMDQKYSLIFCFMLSCGELTSHLILKIL